MVEEVLLISSFGKISRGVGKSFGDIFYQNKKKESLEDFFLFWRWGENPISETIDTYHSVVSPCLLWEVAFVQCVDFY